MRNGTPRIASLGRSLGMLEAILADRAGRSISALACELGLPVATAHRQVATLTAEAFLARLPRGRYAPGPRLLAMLKLVDEKQVIVAAAAPVLDRLAAELPCIVQLGTLENDMVTYRIKTGHDAGGFFTKVGLQLEAYCSGIGKVLLAHLPAEEREAYLATGPFPALTGNTITDPASLRKELDDVRVQGFACDDEEIAEGLTCIAMPIRCLDGRVLAAISASGSVLVGERQAGKGILKKLSKAVKQIESSITPTSFGS